MPARQFYMQIAALKNTRSLTARLFARAESALNRCQAGNGGLPIEVITVCLASQVTSAQRI